MSDCVSVGECLCVSVQNFMTHFIINVIMLLYIITWLYTCLSSILYYLFGTKHCCLTSYWTKRTGPITPVLPPSTWSLLNLKLILKCYCSLLMPYMASPLNTVLIYRPWYVPSSPLGSADGALLATGKSTLAVLTDQSVVGGVLTPPVSIGAVC